MTYVLGQPIEASDYNTLAAQINTVFGTGTGDSGYGGNSKNVGVSNLPTMSVSDVIQSATDTIGDGSPPGDPDEWINLRNAFFDCAAHQATVLADVLPSETLLEDGDLATFFSTLDSAPNSAAILANKDVHTGESFAIANKLTSTRNTAWSTFLRHEFTIDFGNENAARHYFNTGGDLRISASRTGGTVAPPDPLLPGASASVQNANWDALLTGSGQPYILSTYASYIALTGSYATVFGPHTGSGSYTSNTWIIRAKVENVLGVLGGNGSVIRFQSDFTDGHINGSFPVEDFVDGTFTSTIEERRSTGIFVRPSPTFTTITPLTAGS